MSLIAALTDCAECSLRSKAYRFLAGLSSDELQFIAGFLGGAILERAECTHRRSIRSDSEDLELKLILLREYLSVAGPAVC